MSAELVQEWSQVRSQTLEDLRAYRHLLRTKHTPLLQFLVMPAFVDARCVDVMQADKEYAAFSTTWQVTRDAIAFSSPIERLKHPRLFIPSIQTRPLDWKSEFIANSILKPLSEVYVPLLSSQCGSIVLDGTRFELCARNGGALIRLVWYSGSEGWHPESVPNEWLEVRGLIEVLELLSPEQVGV